MAWRAVFVFLLLAGCLGSPEPTAEEPQGTTFDDQARTPDALAPGDAGVGNQSTYRTIAIDEEFLPMGWACIDSPATPGCGGISVGAVPSGPLIPMGGILRAVDLQVTSLDPIVVGDYYYVSASVADEVPCEGPCSFRWQGFRVAFNEGTLSLALKANITEPEPHEYFWFWAGPKAPPGAPAHAAVTTGWRVAGTILVEDPPLPQPSS